MRRPRLISPPGAAPAFEVPEDADPLNPRPVEDEAEVDGWPERSDDLLKRLAEAYPARFPRVGEPVELWAREAGKRDLIDDLIAWRAAAKPHG